jgi:hypothetical protein
MPGPLHLPCDQQSEQKEQMVKDDILEASSSPFLNPLTIVQREGKKIRISESESEPGSHCD